MNADKISWPTTLFILGYHLFLLIALPIYFIYYTPSWPLIAISLAIVFICGIGITAGYHRLYAHSTYKTNRFVEFIFLFITSVATQGSALRWASDHRMHHAFVDTDKDPYSVKKGFMHAHILWMFKNFKSVDPKVVADLLKNPLLVFQDRHYVFCMVASNAIVFLAVGWLLNDYLGAFLFAWWARLLVSHHSTWCINSLAHMWGSQNFSQEHSAVDNYLISFITYGEGYHNYHHSFANDYRNGIRWYHYDPGKWVIWGLSKIGMARDLKKISNFRITKHLVNEHMEKLIEALKNTIHFELNDRVSKIGNRLLDEINNLQTLYENYKVIPRSEAKAIREQIRQSKKVWKQNWKEWKMIIRDVNQAKITLAH
jgi:stearoyl-CoA desaturase (delta-9 desaturase)